MRSATIVFALLGFALPCAPLLASADFPTEPEIALTAPQRGVYQGPVINGQAKGRFSNGDIYEGEWKNGKPDGIGTMTYMLGGSYEGEWKKGKREGKGVMTFAGTERRAEVRFVNDHRVDVPAEQVPADTAAAQFSMRSGEALTGSHLINKVVFANLPVDQSFEQLTADQQRLVRSYYPALDAGDEPAYPVNGARDLYKLLVALVRNVDIVDSIQIYVALDADANVTSVTTISNIDQQAKNLIAAGAGLLKYKPARCGGQSCAGVVPFNLQMRTRL